MAPIKITQKDLLRKKQIILHLSEYAEKISKLPTQI